MSNEKRTEMSSQSPEQSTDDQPTRDTLRRSFYGGVYRDPEKRYQLSRWTSRASQQFVDWSVEAPCPWCWARRGDGAICNREADNETGLCAGHTEEFQMMSRA